MDKIATKLALQKLSTQIANALDNKQDTIPFDSSLSEVSKNPIENKAVYNQYMTNDEVKDLLLSLNPNYLNNQYLTLRIESVPSDYAESGYTVDHLFNVSDLTVLDISIDGGNWFTYDRANTHITLYPGTTIRMKSTQQVVTLSQYYSSTYSYTALFDKNTFSVSRAATLDDLTYSIYGNILSLVYGDNFKGKDETLPSAPYLPHFKGFFSLLKGLVDASDLVLLSAKTDNISNNGGIYEDLFRNTNVAKIPKLPATVLTDRCYYHMFYFDTYLTEAPELPATTVAPYCYYEMFWKSKITKTPDLPALTMYDYCYYGMFSNCDSLVTAPKVLPATTLAENCYASMFASTRITKAPILPATTLAKVCYQSMFSNCASLTKAADLPATVAAERCYDNMYYGCVALVNSPVIALTTLAKQCCEQMFKKCTSLVIGPVLAATASVASAYKEMFNYCSSMTEVTCMLAENNNGSIYQFVGNTQIVGTLYKNPNATFWANEYIVFYNKWAAVNATVYTVSLVANPASYGYVYGNGPYRSGQNASLMVHNKSGHTFAGWELNGSTVSHDNPYTPTVTADVTYTANFV